MGSPPERRKTVDDLLEDVVEERSRISTAAGGPDVELMKARKHSGTPRRQDEFIAASEANLTGLP